MGGVARRVTLVAVTLALLPCAQSLGATIPVTTNADEFNGNGVCSLREALDSSFGVAHSGCVAGTGTDTIQLAATQYTLSIGPGVNDDNNAGGDLDVRSHVTILGLG